MIKELQDEFLKCRQPDTPVAIVTHALRSGQTIEITTLDCFLEKSLGMNSVVIIGNSDTDFINEKIVTKRGYEKKDR